MISNLRRFSRLLSVARSMPDHRWPGFDTLLPTPNL